MIRRGSFELPREFIEVLDPLIRGKTDQSIPQVEKPSATP
jgi:hypothetical protein